MQVSCRSCSAYRAGSVPVSWCRSFSSDAPPEGISRYPVPNKKELPYDMVELMDEVETKVLKEVFTVYNNSPTLQVDAYQYGVNCHFREDFCPMSSKCCHTGQPSSEPSLPTIVNLWTKRLVCIASLCPLHHAHAMGVMWEMFVILKTVFSQVPCLVLPQTPLSI